MNAKVCSVIRIHIQKTKKTTVEVFLTNLCAKVGLTMRIGYLLQSDRILRRLESVTVKGMFEIYIQFSSLEHFHRF